MHRWRNEMYLTVISALDNQILYRRNLTADSSDATYRVYAGNSPAPMSPGLATPGAAQAAVVSRTLLTTPAADAIASPDGWIPDGVNETRGNNVDAHLDRNDDDVPDLPRPTGNPSRVFDFPLDLSGNPLTYGDAAAVQLFYWNNWMHDALYVLGFTEAGGNFQDNNFGRGGLAGDAVQADAQDGASLNDGRHHDNANMSTPPDGYAPRMQMYTFTGAEPDRDGSLDAEIILHEYAHGLSTRLIGGGAGIDALQSAGMGEGWSDFYALALLADPTADVDAAYPMSPYMTYHGFNSSFEENYYYGIRRYPYCTDTNKNPLTFADIDPAQASPHTGVPRSPLAGPFNPAQAGEVHGQGEVWATMLWEMRASLIKKHGFPVAHSLTLQLVTDGLRLAPPNPNFVQARDAILLADRMLTDGANAPEIWAAFTKRGLGYGAKAPYAYTTSGVTESHTPAPALVIEQVQIQGGNGNGIIETNEDNSLLITVRNQGTGMATGVSVQLATTTPGVQLLAAQSAYEDIPQGQSRGNAVTLQLRTLPEFVDGTRIDVNVTISSAQQTVTITLPFYPDNSGPKLPSDENNSFVPTSSSADMPDLTIRDLNNLEPLWLAEDGSCLLKAGEYKYVLWKRDGATNVIVNPQYKFLAHRLTQHGVVVGTVIEPDTTDEAGNKVRHNWGAWWDFSANAPVPLTRTSGYSWPKNTGPLSYYGKAYSSLLTDLYGQPLFLTNVTSYPTLHDVWDLNSAGVSVGSLSMQATFAPQQILFDGLGEMNWFTATERGLDAGRGSDPATQVNYWAQLTTAAQFTTPENWRWLGPLNWVTPTASALLINDGGMIAGVGAVHLGDPTLDALRPTHVFRAPAAGEAAPFTTLVSDLGALPGGLHSFPHAMNQAGELVGQSDFGGGNNPFDTHAVFWGATATSPTNLGTLGPVPEAANGYSIAYDINDYRQVVGTSLRIANNGYTTTSAGALWQLNHSTNGTPFWEITDLNVVAGGTNRWYLNAVGINNAGVILAKRQPVSASQAAQNQGAQTTTGTSVLLMPAKFIPDPNTHQNDKSVTILPGDVEKVTAIFSFGTGRKIYYRIKDTSVARLNGVLTAPLSEWPETSVEAATTTMELNVAGLKTGRTVLEARLDFPDIGTLVQEIPVVVGGEVNIKYAQPPTFKSSNGGDSGGTGRPSGTTDFVMGGAAKDSGSPDARAGISPEVIAQFGDDHKEAQDAPLLITVLDGDGNPKKGKRVSVVPKNGKLFNTMEVELIEQPPGSIIQDNTTRPDGKYLANIRCLLNDSSKGTDKDALAVLVGKAADDVKNNRVAAELQQAWTTKKSIKHKNNLQYLEHNEALETSSGAFTCVTFEMPMIDHYQYKVIQHRLAGSVYKQDLTEPAEVNGEIQFDNYANGAPNTVTDNASNPPFQLAMPEIQGIIGDAVKDYRASDKNAEIAPAAGQSPQYGAIAAEIALGTLPGYDFVDICKEYIWKAIIKREDPNNVVGIFSLIGLSFDAGYFTGPVAAIAKSGCAMLKSVVKRVAQFAPTLFRVARTSAGSVITAIKNFAIYVYHMPGGVVPKVIGALEQWTRLLNTKIAGGFAKEEAAEAATVLASKATVSAIESAQRGAEGIAILSKAGKKKLADDIVAQFPAELADEAFEGVRVAQAAAEAGNLEISIIQDIVKSDLVTAARAQRVFGNIKAVEDVEGVVDYVQYLKNNCTNPNGIDGAIFESTVARQIKSGQVPGSGSLQRISNDGVKEMQQIDTVTANWCVQVKHQTRIGDFDWSQLGRPKAEAESYLNLIREQAKNAGKVPVLIINQQTITPALQELLAPSEGKAEILWRFVQP